MRIREQTLRPDHPELAKSLNNLANVYEEEGKYAQAEPLYQRALALAERANGPNHPDVAALLDNFVMLYLDQHNYSAAEPLADRAIDIVKHAGGEPRMTFKCFRDRARLRWETQRRELAVADLEQASKPPRRCEPKSREQKKIAPISSATIPGPTGKWSIGNWNWGIRNWHLPPPSAAPARTLIDQMNVQGTDLLAGNATRAGSAAATA